jgi:hypothetical protein
MPFFVWIRRFALIAVCVSVLSVAARAQGEEERDAEFSEERQSWVERTGARAAYVADGRLAALRMAPAADAALKQRLRVGRRVYVLMTRKSADGQAYHFVATTRRTRGWMDARCLVRAGRRGDDVRLLNVALAETGGFERLRLCRMFVSLFPRSPLTPKALLEMGATADAEADALTRRAEKRVGAGLASGNADERAYFDNDVVLDRFNRLGVIFHYHPELKKYRYDGWAFRQLATRYKNSPEAERARTRLERP